MGVTVRLTKGYKVRSNATEDSIWHFAESELNIPNVLINIPNRRGNIERNVKITFEDVTVNGGCRVVFKYANASGNMYNHIVSFKSDSTVSVNFGDRIAVESISMVMDKYYQFMDSIICLEEMSVEDMERGLNERRERFLRNMRDSERSSRNPEWSVSYDDVENDFYDTIAGIRSRSWTRQSTDF